ncbi:hypothetical protein ACJRO7_027364 [Eucalyptus globulus]|uniref:TIR domain-containing protein n=1 Tax=Eucalyptus globulus TaxID=34317 RepID=A0ABD3JW42_EUCGL
MSVAGLKQINRRFQANILKTGMALALKSTWFAQFRKPIFFCGFSSSQLPVVSTKRTTAMAARGAKSTTSISETFAKLKKMGKVVPQSIAIFSNYNPILKFGVERFMSTINDAGVHGQRSPGVYGVFISYKQNDMLHTVSHLKGALERRGIRTFVDFTLDGGVKFQRVINDVIEQSEIAVVVASQSYHFSPWCLNELVKILECQKKGGLILLPIFWGINARELREQSILFMENIGQGKKGFKQDNPHQIQRWRDALRALGMIKGWSASASLEKTEAEVIEELADKISAKLNRSV